MPLAFCVIELVFDANGRGVDFVFRYCNEEMAGYLCRRSFKRYKGYFTWLQSGNRESPDYLLLSATSGVLCMYIDSEM